jgi:hypothetical protein
MAILPDGLKHIEHEAFRDFDLEYIHIPKSVQYIGSKAFIGCTFAKENFVNDSALDGEKNGYWGAKIVDEEIDGMFIVNDAQNGNTLDGVRYFLPCFNIPNGVEFIGNGAFRSGGGGVLKSVTIPDSVKNIGEFAFAHLPITELTIPAAIAEIGKGVFEGCDKLCKVYSKIEDPSKCDVKTLDSSAEGFYKQATLVVPNIKGIVSAYKKKAAWKKFSAIVMED